jgi:hypothetical protein
MPIFGENSEYDNKCFTLYKVDKNKEKTIENLENVIENDTKLVETNKTIMDACCSDGYKWSEEMYNTHMLEWFKKQ